jgi:hypothetical protein
MKKATFYFDDDDLEWLREEQERTDVPQATLVRKALKEFRKARDERSAREGGAREGE